MFVVLGGRPVAGVQGRIRKIERTPRPVGARRGGSPEDRALITGRPDATSRHADSG